MRACSGQGSIFRFIHVRDDWLKCAALYWPSIRRIVPIGYRKHDSPVARAFADAGILGDQNPAWLADATAFNLVEALSRNARALTRQYGIKNAYRDWDGQPWGETRQPR